MQVTPVSKTLTSVLRENFWRIPRFQRPYSWDTDNISDFWYDLTERHTDEYFMGSLVTFKDGKEPNLLYIVDGQQRLTTITIALAVIRDALDAIGETDSADGIQGFLEARDLDNKRRFVLEHEPPNPFFQKRIQQRNPDPSVTANTSEQDALERAHQHFTSSIFIDFLLGVDLTGASKTKEEQKQYLITLRNRLLALQFISIELTNEEDASLIFETLNTRGKDLQVADLIKNLLSRLIKPATKGMDSVLENWNGIRTLFDNLSIPVDIDTFLLHYWLSRYSYVSKAKLFKEFKGKVKKSTASSFLADIRKDADSYALIVAPSQGKWNKEERALRDSLAALNVFQVARAFPLVLSIVRLWREKVIDLKSAKRAIGYIEDFTFQFNAVTSSRGGGGIANMYARLAQTASQAATAQEFANLSVEIRKKFSERKVLFEEFAVAWAQVHYTSDRPRDRRLVKYILMGLAKHNGLPSEVDPELYTIEHIWPESRAHELKDPAAVGKLGNLILVSEKVNGELKSKPFDQKLAILLQHGVAMDDHLRTSASWGLEQIKARTSYLAATAYEDIWTI